MAMRLPIYLDHNATTPMDERVFEAMRPYFIEQFGNAASRAHSVGWAAEAAVDKGRRQVAAILGANPNAIVWTSGATESNNLAIKGAAEANHQRGRHIITQVTEHKAVLDPCKTLQKQGFDVTWLPVDTKGRVNVYDLLDAIRPDTMLVSIMHANNETGTVNPIREIGAICRERNILFHTDATQAVGKLPIDVEADHIDLLSLSGHKFHGPKGCGALFVRHKNPTVKVAAQIDGGGHERGMRSGTLNVPGIVGLGAACEVAMVEMSVEAPRLASLRDRLEHGIMSRLDGVTVNGDPQHRLPHVTNLSFADVDGDVLLSGLTDLCVSSGSACTSASLEPSYVLRALGVPSALAFCSLRFSLGRSNTPEEIDFAIEKVTNVVMDCRAGSAAQRA
jgi:cysteine desulfurase